MMLLRHIRDIVRWMVYVIDACRFVIEVIEKPARHYMQHHNDSISLITERLDFSPLSNCDLLIVYKTRIFLTRLG